MTGLSRSERNDANLQTLAAQTPRGDLADHDSLRRGIDGADAVIHLAFGAFSQDLDENFERGRIEADDISAMGAAIAGTGKPLVTTSGCGLVANGVALIQRNTDQLVHIPRQAVAQ